MKWMLLSLATRLVQPLACFIQLELLLHDCIHHLLFGRLGLVRKVLRMVIRDVLALTGGHSFKLAELALKALNALPVPSGRLNEAFDLCDLGG